MSERQAGPEDFELEEGHKPLVGQTLEQVTMDGESDWEKEQPQKYVTLNTAPQWVISTMVYLKRKHTNVPSVSAVERLTAKLGVAVIREEYGALIKDVAQLKRRVFELGNQLPLIRASRDDRYKLSESIVVNKPRRQCALREWVAGAITDGLVDPLGIPFCDAVLLSLIAGIAKSEEWVPKSWVGLAVRELSCFAQYFTDEVGRLRQILEEKK